MNKYRLLPLQVFISLPQIIFADSNPDFFQSIGKINVVVVVICILFLGIALFLFRLDSKINKIEKKLNNESKTS